MPAPFLVVELPTTSASPEQAAALIAACSAAVRPGRCELASDSEDQPASAIAIVSFEAGARPRAIVEVGRRRAARAVWLSDELTFRAADSAIEQYRSIGLTVAVLFRELTNVDAQHADERHAREARDARALESPQTKVVRPQEAVDSSHEMPNGRSERARGPRAWLAIAGLTGWDPGTGALRLGGAASVGLAPVRPLVIGISGRYRHALASGSDLTFATVGVGAGGDVAFSRKLWLRARAEVLAENVTASAREPATGQTETQSLWTAGLGASIDLVWVAGRWWGLWLTVMPEHLARGTTVELHRRAIATVSPTSVELGLGLEFYPLAP